MTVSIDDIVDVLNQAAASDPVATGNLIAQRVKCNTKLADHPTIQVSPEQTVGLLGIINGIIGSCGMKPIAAIVNTDGTIHKFIRGPVINNGR